LRKHPENRTNSCFLEELEVLILKNKSLSLLVFVLSVLVLSACVGQNMGENQVNSNARVVIGPVQVEEFLIFSQPRRITFAEAVNGYTQIWFDETPEGDGYINNTLVFSRNGCPLARPPI
jgi:hypothetical protein